MITVTNLSKNFNGHEAVKNVSFILENHHKSTALIGPNGAGKTTTLSMLAGLLKPTSGQIQLEGVHDIRTAIGFLPQYPQFFSWLTALEYMEMAAQLSGIPIREAKRRSEEMLIFVGLEKAMRKRIGTFSGGMKQRLGIAQAIVHKPKLLLLDEPVSALDPVGRREIMNLLKELQQQTQILYSTHILNDAEEMTNQLLFLNHGELVEKGSLAEVKKKYEANQFIIEFEKQEDAQLFSSHSNYKTKVEGNITTIEIQNEIPFMQHLLSELSNSPYVVRRVERKTANLEEIFLKVVGQ